MVYSTVTQIVVRIMPISDIMNVDIIRDKVMDQVAPIDVVNFMIGTGIRFSKEDSKRYRSIIKYIIPNRRWLQSKLREGYVFTVVGTHLSMLTDPIKNELSTRQWTKGRSWPMHVCNHMWLIMIVTKENYTIPCTNDFLDGSGIITKAKNKKWPEAYNLRRDESIAPLTMATTGWDEAPIILSCVTDIVNLKQHVTVDSSSSAYAYMIGRRPMEEIEYLTIKLDGVEKIVSTELIMVYPFTDLSEFSNTITVVFDEAYPQLPASEAFIVCL
jgi:hypothetical protein